MSASPAPLLDPLQLARSALAGRAAWLVGGALRDRILGAPSFDLDVVLEGDPAQAARSMADQARRRGARAASFALSEDFGAWRVVGPGGAWQVDFEPLRGSSLGEDLALRDFTVNAIAEPLQGGEPIDPLGGIEDLAGGRLRAASERAFADDPLRILRLVRMTVELGLRPEPATVALARDQASGLHKVSGERIFMELRRVIAAPEAVRGLLLLEALGATAVILPELEALHGVGQSRYHHLDVHGHTLEVLQRTIDLDRDPAEAVGSELAPAVRELLDEPLADTLDRGEALRWGALLHDIAKPDTRGIAADGRVTFVGHDDRGARMAREILTRLRASERLRLHVSGLVRHHLRVGFLVHQPQPLPGEILYRFLRATQPLQADVTLLTIADRQATRGERSEPAIQAHMAVVAQLLGPALRWYRVGPPAPLLRGDRLAAELAIAPGPRLGEILEELAEARYAGRIETPAQALALARELARR